MFPETRRHQDAYLQGVCDSLGLSLDGKWSKKARARRIVLDATAEAELAPAVEDIPDEPEPPAPLPVPAGRRYEWAGCVHEAGHAVGALAVGARVAYASVARGGVTWRTGAADDAAEAVVVYSGPLAELLLCAGSDPFAHPSTGAPGGDMFNLFALGLSSAAVATARAEGVRLVSVHRDAIAKVAGVLATRGVIDGHEAAELFAANRGRR